MKHSRRVFLLPLMLALLACGGSGNASSSVHHPADDDTSPAEDDDNDDQSPDDDDDSSPDDDNDDASPDDDDDDNDTAADDDDDDASPPVDDDDNDNDDNDDNDDSTGIVWLSVPGGTADMGCIPGDTNCQGDENPRHAVTISAFQITETSITQGQYQATTGQNPSGFANCGANCPVETVAWANALAFCQAVGGRLPTEAEWEYAARAWTNEIYYCGNDPSCLSAIAWYSANSGGTTHPVCGLQPNAWGLCDMLGNVDQWVNDWYDPNYYASSPQNNPQGPSSGTDRVVRGGSFGDDATTLRISARGWLDPGSALGAVGFRCARDSDDDDDDDDNDNDDDNDDSAPMNCNPDGTCCTDPTTGLMWQNGPTVGTIGYVWADAKTYCTSLTWCGYSDWRLPDIDALRSLIRGCTDTESGGACGVTDNCLDLRCRNAACAQCSGSGPGPGGAFWPPEITGDISSYWSSSAVADANGYEWYVGFYFGIVYFAGVDVATSVRCVR